MSEKRITRMRIYFGSTLVAEVTDSKYSHVSNDEQGHATDSSDYFSDGNDTTEVDWNTIVPQNGHSIGDLKLAVIQKKSVKVSILADGALEELTGRLISREYSSEAKSGMMKSAWKFIGGAPKVV